MPRRPLVAALTVAALAALAATGAALARDGDAPPASATSAPSASVAPAHPPVVTLDSARLARAYARADSLPRLRSLLVQWRDTLVGERYWRGAAPRTPANIKSASKSVLSALVGIALADGHLRALDQPLAELLPAHARALDSAKRAITLEDLLTMRAGLQSTSFGNYGRWVTSRDWVRWALARPMEEAPGHAGGPMIYSTGTTHVLAAALARATGTSVLAYGRRRLAEPLGIPLRPWPTDPQGIHFGGNDMRMTPREMLAFGTLYLHGGRAPDGAQVVPRAWVDSSWVPRTRSGWSDQDYGYGWWSRQVGAHRVNFAWGYGGQFIFVVPSLDLVVVTTSDPSATSRERGHLEAIHALVAQDVLAAVGG